MSGAPYAVYESPSGTVVSGTEANDRATCQILSFARLRNGWHYGEGRGATGIAVDLALAVNSLLSGRNAHEIEVFPDVGGGILVSGYRENETLEILCGPGGRMDVLHEIDGDIAHERRDVSLDEIDEYARGLAWTSKKSYDYFIPGTSVKERDVSRVWRSGTLQVAAVYRSSQHSVLENVAEPNAHTYIVFTTPRFPEIHRFSGG